MPPIIPLVEMFNWSGKQALQDDDGPPPVQRRGSFSSNNGVNIEAFDHTFKGEIHTVAGDCERLQVFGSCSFERRSCRIVCSANLIEIIEEVSLSKVNKAEVPYRMVRFTSLDSYDTPADHRSKLGSLQQPGQDGAPIT